MACEDCRHARATNGHWTYFDSLKCTWCAARLIQAIQNRVLPREVRSQRMSVALKESVAAGLNEARIRAMVKGPLPLEPVSKETKSK